MPNTSRPECLLLCNEKGCAKKQKKAYAKLARRLTDAGIETKDVACQGSCIGPTVVLTDADGPRWFEDLRTKSSQEAVVEASLRVARGKKAKPAKSLQKRELTGKQRRRAQKRLAKALDTT